MAESQHNVAEHAPPTPLGTGCMVHAATQVNGPLIPHIGEIGTEMCINDHVPCGAVRARQPAWSLSPAGALGAEQICTESVNNGDGDKYNVRTAGVRS